MEEKNKIKINLFTFIIIIALIIIIIMGFFVYRFYKDKKVAENQIADLNNEITSLKNMVNNLDNNIDQGKKDTKDIIKYELQTHEYFEDLPKENKYYINSEEELNSFYKIYSDALDIDKDYLKDNSIFIQVEEASSGSIKFKLSSVEIDKNTVKFVIDKDTPEVGTADMAFWYLVAIIPNNQLKDLKLNDWNKPSEVNSSTNVSKDESNNDSRRILIKKSYSNYAWGSQFNGKAIFSDGTIYSWDSKNESDDWRNYDLSSIDELTDFLSEYGNLENTKVSEEDLEKIKDYINDLEDDIDIRHPGADMGTTVISAINSDNEKIDLKLKGDSEGENKTKNAQELLEIINNYL